jgi:signal transduction histidine kinase
MHRDRGDVSSESFAHARVFRSRESEPPPHFDPADPKASKIRAEKAGDVRFPVPGRSPVSAGAAALQDRERQALARELHDRIGQNLAALDMNLRLIGRALASNSTAQIRPRLDDCLRLVANTLDSTDGLMSELRPFRLEEHGLVAALADYAQALSQRTGIRVRVRAPQPQPRLAGDVQTALYCVAREACMNAVKHARATCLTVTVSTSAGSTRLSVVDDGCGLDTRRDSGRSARTGWGLAIMQERMQAVGGRLTVRSAPGRGTAVVAEVEARR